MRLLGWQLPTGIMRGGVEMLSNAALPIVLLSLGIQLGATKRVKLTRAVWTATLIRVLGMPFLSLGGIGLLFGLRGVPLQALVLAGAMPTAVNAFLLAMEYKGGDVRTTADTVTMTTILSLFSAAAVTAALPLLP